MRLCIWHQNFDADISSGTLHSTHMWHETCAAFGVTHLAVINESEHKFSPPSRAYEFESFSTFEAFKTVHAAEGMVYVELGDFPNHREVLISDTNWLIVGGTAGLPLGEPGVQYVTIPTQTILYPREAAAIVLENQWQSRLLEKSKTALMPQPAGG